MDPIFTIQWPEFAVAEKLQTHLSRKEGYSILIPLSRQEKGIDLAIIKTTTANKSAVTTIQVKASRTYLPRASKRKNTIRYQYYTWFTRFDIPERADFIILFGMYPVNLERPGKGSKKYYRDYSLSLIFSNYEMHQFFKECKTKEGKPDRMFSFGFDDLQSPIIKTRGDMDLGKLRKDFSDFLLEKRIGDIKAKLNGEEPTKTVPIILDN